MPADSKRQPALVAWAVTWNSSKVALGTRCYFTQPYRAWQRGSIEHLNGLIRRVYPKGTDFTPVTQQDCARLARTLNQRPRRRLGFRTPEECYARWMSHFKLDNSAQPNGGMASLPQ